MKKKGLHGQLQFTKVFLLEELCIHNRLSTACKRILGYFEHVVHKILSLTKLKAKESQEDNGCVGVFKDYYTDVQNVDVRSSSCNAGLCEEEEPCSPGKLELCLLSSEMREWLKNNKKLNWPVQFVSLILKILQELLRPFPVFLLLLVSEEIVGYQLRMYPTWNTNKILGMSLYYMWNFSLIFFLLIEMLPWLTYQFSLDIYRLAYRKIVIRISDCKAGAHLYKNYNRNSHGKTEDLAIEIPISNQGIACREIAIGILIAKQGLTCRENIIGILIKKQRLTCRVLQITTCAVSKLTTWKYMWASEGLRGITARRQNSYENYV